MAHKLKIAFRLSLLSGFEVFKRRLQDELDSLDSESCSELPDDEYLMRLYRRGESPSFVLARLCTNH